MAVDRFSAPETLAQFSGAWKAAESEEETAVEWETTGGEGRDHAGTRYWVGVGYVSPAGDFVYSRGILKMGSISCRFVGKTKSS